MRGSHIAGNARLTRTIVRLVIFCFLVSIDCRSWAMHDCVHHLHSHVPLSRLCYFFLFLFIADPEHARLHVPCAQNCPVGLFLRFR